MEADLSDLKLDPADCLNRFRSHAARLEWGSVMRRNRDGDSTFRKSTEFGSACIQQHFQSAIREAVPLTMGSATIGSAFLAHSTAPLFRGLRDSRQGSRFSLTIDFFMTRDTQIRVRGGVDREAGDWRKKATRITSFSSSTRRSIAAPERDQKKTEQRKEIVLSVVVVRERGPAEFTDDNDEDNGM